MTKKIRIYEILKNWRKMCIDAVKVIMITKCDKHSVRHAAQRESFVLTTLTQSPHCPFYFVRVGDKKNYVHCIMCIYMQKFMA